MQAAQRAIASANRKSSRESRAATDVSVRVHDRLRRHRSTQDYRAQFWRRFVRRPVMSMPLFDGGLIASHIDQAKAKAHSATAQARQTEYLLKKREWPTRPSLRGGEAAARHPVARAADRGR